MKVLVAQLCLTLWLPRTVALQVPLSVGFSRQENRSGLPCPSPGDLPNPGIKPTSLMSPALSSKFLITRATWEARWLLFSCSVMSDALWAHGMLNTRLPCPSLSPRLCSSSCPLSWWCHPTISSSVFSSSFLALSLSQHQGLFQWVGSLHQVAKLLELQLQNQSFQWVFRVDFL